MRTLENAQKDIKNILKIAHFLMLHIFSEFLVLHYEEVVLDLLIPILLMYDRLCAVSRFAASCI